MVDKRDKVPIDISDVLDSIGDMIGDLFVVIGVVLFFASLLLMSRVYQWFSVFTLLLGVTFLASGLAIRLEGPLTFKRPSRSGFGTILICVSLVTIASAGICALLTTPEGIRVITIIWKSMKSEYMHIDFGPPLAWLVIPLATIGFSLLIGGVLLKFSDVYEGGPNIKELKFAISRLKKSPFSIIGLGIIMFFVAIVLLAPVLAPPGDPTQEGELFKMPKDGVSVIPKAPNLKHPFGTLRYQYDVFYGCIWGTVHALLTGILVVSSALAIGLAIGIAAGYFGGTFDDLAMMFTNIMLAFPGLLLAMAFVSVFAPLLMSGPDAILLALVLAGWPAYSRIIRGEILRVKTEDYVEAAKAVGCSDIRIIFKHILPNSIYPILIMASIDMGSIVLSIATLSFLGIGIEEGRADWGHMIALARNDIYFNPTNPFAHWFTFFIPGLFILTFVLGWNLLGDAMRDVLDPTLRRS